MRNRLSFAMLTVLTVCLLAPCGLTAAPPDQSCPGPRFTLRPGERYFRVDGQPAFALGRNPAGMRPKAYEEHFRHAAAAGERFMRIHFTFSPPGEKAGQVDAGMLQAWDAILDAAEKYNLAVLPVLGLWSAWNDGSQIKTWHAWHKNAFNVARGGPAICPPGSQRRRDRQRRHAARVVSRRPLRPA